MIETGAAENGFSVTREQAERLAQYSSAVLELNNKINLTAIRDEKDFIERNILDSLMIAADIPGSGASIADVGTGGGFPGIPLAVCLPEDSFVLIDSTRKKLDAVEEAAKPLGLENVCYLNGRAEELGREGEWREHFDCVVSRAVASLRVLTELCLPLVKPGGKMIAMKSARYEEEIDEAKEAVEQLGGRISDVQKRYLLHSDMLHVIITIEKIRKTPQKLPRSFGQIKKKPL